VLPNINLLHDDAGSPVGEYQSKKFPCHENSQSRLAHMAKQSNKSARVDPPRAVAPPRCQPILISALLADVRDMYDVAGQVIVDLEAYARTAARDLDHAQHTVFSNPAIPPLNQARAPVLYCAT
jgi:hypothetical protein